MFNQKHEKSILINFKLTLSHHLCCLKVL